MYRVRNTARAARTFYDARGRAVTLAPGASRTVDVPTRLAALLATWLGDVEWAGEQPPAPGVPETPAVPADDPADEQSPEEAAVETLAEKARDLLERSEDMVYAELLKLAKALLGDDWPRGNQSRREIQDILREAAGRGD